MLTKKFFPITTCWVNLFSKFRREKDDAIHLCIHFLFLGNFLFLGVAKLKFFGFKLYRLSKNLGIFKKIFFSLRLL